MTQELFRAAQLISTLPDGRQLARAVFEFDAAGPAIHVMPLGPVAATRDGRSFQVSDPARVIAASELPCLVDWEHESERANGSTRAAGWITSFAVERSQGGRRAGVWGVVEWTDEGLADIKKRSYRFLSPVLILDNDTRDVQAIASVALTNRPALYLDGIDRDAFSARVPHSSKGPTMTTHATSTLTPAVRRSLHAKGLTDEQIEKAQQYRAQQLAEVHRVDNAPAPQRGRPQRHAHASLPSTAAVSDASTVDRILLSRGLTQEQINNARRYRADQRAAGER